jgi:hypothetical protein
MYPILACSNFVHTLCGSCLWNGDFGDKTMSCRHLCAQNSPVTTRSLYIIGYSHPMIQCLTLVSLMVQGGFLHNANGSSFHPGTIYNLPKKMEVTEIYIEMCWTMFPIKPSHKHVRAKARVRPFISREGHASIGRNRSCVGSGAIETGVEQSLVHQIMPYNWDGDLSVGPTLGGPRETQYWLHSAVKWALWQAGEQRFHYWVVQKKFSVPMVC